MVHKFGTYICLWLPYICAKFQPDWSMHSQVKAVFVFVRMWEKKNKKKKKLSLVTRISEMAGTIYFKFAFCYRRALSPQIWCSSDKRSRIYECMKITTLLFLLIYSLAFACVQGFLGCTTRYHVSWLQGLNAHCRYLLLNFIAIIPIKLQIFRYTSLYAFL